MEKKLRIALFLVLIFSCVLTSCKVNIEKNESMKETYKEEIRETEKAFARLAKEKGLKVAFTTYAAEDAVLNRSDKLIKGKNAIEAYYAKQTLQNVKLEWEPEFVEVAVSGDLGYTYGPYTFSANDSTGKEINAKGIFHTVWKKQSDGKWRYVWD